MEHISAVSSTTGALPFVARLEAARRASVEHRLAPLRAVADWLRSERDRIVVLRVVETTPTAPRRYELLRTPSRPIGVVSLAASRYALSGCVGVFLDTYWTETCDAAGLPPTALQKLLREHRYLEHDRQRLTLHIPWRQREALGDLARTSRVVAVKSALLADYPP